MGHQSRRTVNASLPRSRRTLSSLLRPPTATGEAGSPSTSDTSNMNTPSSAAASQNPADGADDAGRIAATGVVDTVGVGDATTGAGAGGFDVVPPGNVTGPGPVPPVAGCGLVTPPPP